MLKEKYMKITKALLVSVAAISLVACSSGHGTEIEQKEFVAEAQKVEEEQYTKATLTYSISSKASGYEADNESLKGKITFTRKDGQFVMDEGQKVENEVASYVDMVGQNVKNSLDEMSTAPEGYKFKYYKAPLGFSFEYTYNADVEGLKGTMSTNAYVEFDKAGLIVKQSITSTSKYSGDVAGTKVSYSTTTASNFTVSYK